MADYVDDVSDFRAMLHDLRLVAVQPDMTKRPGHFRPAHLVDEQQQALCGPGYVTTETISRIQLGWRYKPLDGFMDSLGPVLAAVTVTLWYTP